jgi:hypothetical protein
MPHVPDDPRVESAKRMIKEVIARLADRAGARFTLQDGAELDAAIDLLAEGIRAETVAAVRIDAEAAEAPSATSAADVIPIDSARRGGRR